MKNETIHSILTEIAEEAVPPADINLWERLRYRLETSESHFSKGETLMNPNYAKRPMVLRAVLASVAAVSIFIFFLFTPTGQALAQSILQFFTRVTAPQFALTPQGTAPQETESDFSAACGGYSQPTCTVAQVRRMVSFDVRGLSEMPDGMRFAGATGGPEQIMLTYLDGKGGAILVDERPWSDAEDQLWEVSVTAVVETVTIGPLEGSGGYTTGEYAVGGWIGPSFRQWDSSADMQTLRWRLDDTVYSMASVSRNHYQGRLLDKSGMAAIAAAMTDDPAVLAATPMVATLYAEPQFSFPTGIPYSGWIQTVQEAGALAGFPVIEPTRLPPGYAFNHASYVPSKRNVCLFYAHPLDASSEPSLVILENASGNLPDLAEWTRLSIEYFGFTVDPSWYNTPATPVSVGGALDGQAASSHLGQLANLECGENMSMFTNTLLWKTVEGRSFIIMADGGPSNPFLTTLEARRLAENLNGVSTIPADQVDPERLASAEAAESMLGSDILIPTRLPDGYGFNVAQYVVEGGIRTVKLSYSFGPTRYISIIIQAGVTETLEEVFNQNPEVAQRLTLRGLPAVYLQGSLNVDTDEWCWSCPGAQILTWFENGMEYQIVVSYPTSATKEALVDIAESMR
jgi:hypothetical protein